MGSCFHRIDCLEGKEIPAFIALLEPIFVLIHSCLECMLCFRVHPQDSISLHQLSTCIILYGKLDDLDNLEGCSSHTAVKLPTQNKEKVSKSEATWLLADAHGKTADLWNVIDAMSKPGEAFYPTDDAHQKALLAAKYQVFLDQFQQQREYRAIIDSVYN